MEDFSIFSKEIKEELSKQLGLEGGLYTESFLQQVELKVNDYLKEAKAVMEAFNSELQLYQLEVNNDLSIEYKRWLVAKKMISSNIEGTLKKGYILIDELRESVTGQPVQYFVGVEAGRGKNRKLYEGYLSMEQILSMARLEAIWKNTSNSVFKLRLNARVENLKKSLRPASDKHRSLYGKVLEYASANKIKNTGNIFEAYRVMAATQSSWNEDKFDDIVIDIFQKVRSNTASFAKGGDYLDESIKYFGGSAPSLASLSTIINILENFNRILALRQSELIKVGLSNLFEKDPMHISIENDFQEFSNNEFEDLLNIFSKI